MEMPSFDEMVQLAQSNPQEFEQLRQQLIADLIDNSPVHSQRRLRGLQFRIDMERQLAKTPLNTCLRVSRMMHDQLDRLRQALLNSPQSETSVSGQSADPVASIIPFRQIANR